MTDNPYAAPESSTPPPPQPASQAKDAIRLVSRLFRILGWPLFLAFLIINLMAYCLIAYRGAKWFLGETFMPYSAVPVLALTINAVLMILFWGFIRVGRMLIAPRPRGYWPAMFLSTVLVILVLPAGVFCLWSLHKHWKPYCAEQTELIAQS